jgi:hypothetical protein
MTIDNAQLSAAIEKILLKHGLLGNGNRQRISKNKDGTYSIQVNFWMWVWLAFCAATVLLYVLAPKLQESFSLGLMWLLIGVSLFLSFFIIRAILWLWSILKLYSFVSLFSFVGFQGWLLVGISLVAIYLGLLVWKPNLDISGYIEQGSSFIRNNTPLGSLVDLLNGNQDSEVPSSGGQSNNAPKTDSEDSSVSDTKATNGSDGTFVPVMSDEQLEAQEKGFNLHSDGTSTKIVEGVRCKQKISMSLCNGAYAHDVFPKQCNQSLPCIQGIVNGRKQTSDCSVVSCPTSGSTDSFPG